MFIPSCITLFKNVFFAIDNTDWQIETHWYARWPAINIWHSDDPLSRRWSWSSAPKKMLIKRSSRLQNKSDCTTLSTLDFSKAKEGECWIYFIHFKYRYTLDEFHKHDVVWSMMKSQLDVAKFVLTWETYNLLLTDNLQVTTKFSSSPVINRSSTN